MSTRDRGRPMTPAGRVALPGSGEEKRLFVLAVLAGMIWVMPGEACSMWRPVAAREPMRTEPLIASFHKSCPHPTRAPLPAPYSAAPPAPPGTVRPPPHPIANGVFEPVSVENVIIRSPTPAMCANCAHDAGGSKVRSERSGPFQRSHHSL